MVEVWIPTLDITLYLMLGRHIDFMQADKYFTTRYLIYYADTNPIMGNPCEFSRNVVLRLRMT